MRDIRINTDDSTVPGPATPRASAAPTQPPVKLHGDISTPSGTPLGGYVDISLWDNGDSQADFHMHSSSVFGNFDFVIRAYITAPDLPCFTFIKSGHVSGVDDADYTEQSNNQLVKLYWQALRAQGRLEVTKDYEWGGIIGGLRSVVEDIVSLFGHAVGFVLGAIVGLTREAIGWMGIDLGPGVTIGIIAGVAVFLCATIVGAPVGAAILIAVVAGVATGAVAAALIKSRRLTEYEMRTARLVFGSALDLDKVRVTNLGGQDGRPFTAPGVDGLTYINFGGGYDNPNIPTLIHELTHAWQVERSTFLPGLMCHGVGNQAEYIFENVYDYSDLEGPFSHLNLEQQASIIGHWFDPKSDVKGRKLELGFFPMDEWCPSYHYVLQDIQGGSVPLTEFSTTTTLFRQLYDQLDALFVASLRQPTVSWVVGAGNWASGILPNVPTAAPFKPIAVGRQATDIQANQVDAVWVDDAGAVNVAYVIDYGAWNSIKISGNGFSQPGSGVGLLHRPGHFENLLAALIGSDGGLHITDVTNSGVWTTPQLVGSAGLSLPGTAVALARQTKDQVNAFFTSKDGSVYVAWLNINDQDGLWRPPQPIAPPGSTKTSGNIIAINQMMINQLSVFFIGADGGLKVCWVLDAGRWNGPFAIGPPGLAPPGAYIAAARQALNQLDVFFIGNNGAVYVAWVLNFQPWNGPSPMVAPPGVGLPGGLIAAAPQTPHQLNCVFQGADNKMHVSWVLDSNRWNGPIPLPG